MTGPPLTGVGPGPVAAGRPANTFFTHEQIKAVIWGLVLAMFLAALDQTIVAIALYSIAVDLQGESLMPWIVSGYLVVATVATPIHGKLSDLYGRWPMLSIAIGIYLVASLASAFAQTMTQLLCFRLLQGIGGGGLIVLVQTIIADIVPREQRGRYQAYLSGVFAVAAVSGPVLGGLLTEWLSWRAVFLFNIPLGILAWVITRRGLRHRLSGRRPQVRVDYLGAGLLGAMLASLMIALTRIGRGAPVADPVSLTLMAVSVIALIWLWHREQRVADPILPPELFANRTVMICCTVLGLNFLLMYGSIVLVPLALQTLGKTGTSGMALLMLPFTLGVPLGSYISGKAMQSAMRQRLLLASGSSASAIGALVLAFISYTPGAPLSAGLLFMGVGVGLTIPASIVAVQSAVRPALIGIATATSGLFRTLGGAIGIAAMSSALYAGIPVQGQSGSTAAILGSVDPAELADGFRSAFIVAALAATLALVLCSGLSYSRASADSQPKIRTPS